MTQTLLPLLLILVAVVVISLWFWRKKQKVRPQAPAPPLAPPPPSPQVKLAPSVEELQKKQEAEVAHQQAQALRQQREEAQKSNLAEQAALLKQQEEEAKKAEYRAKKALEEEEKIRRQKEREEAQRLELLEQARLEAERKALEEQAQQRIAAEAGKTLAEGLNKTRTQGFMARLGNLWRGPSQQVDEGVLADLEEILFTADIGVQTATKLLDLAREKLRQKEWSNAEALKVALRREIERMIALAPPASTMPPSGPWIWMVVGVNGAGKTTTIGKLAAQWTAAGKKVVLAAGDTFRAAAAEQLDVWAARAGAELVKGKEDADPASVVFEGLKRALEVQADIFIADTAGRLHTKAPLMEELKKVKRVMAKAVPNAPHEVLLVLDSTNGQNAIAQAKQFLEAVQVSSIALTKLDGTAKGGVVIGICDELKIPVRFVGLGEKVGDLRVFEPKEFVNALFGDSTNAS